MLNENDELNFLDWDIGVGTPGHRKYWDTDNTVALGHAENTGNSEHWGHCMEHWHTETL